MKTRTVLALSLLLAAFVSQRPAPCAAQDLKTSLPDLATRAAKIEDYKVVAVVDNFGKTASGVCVIRLEIIDPNNKAILKTMEVAVPPVAPGKPYYATFDTAPQKAKGNTLRFWIDPSDRVQESDEYNNRSVDATTVVKSSVSTSGGFPKSGDPDLMIKAIAGTPSSRKSLRVEVVNIGGVASVPCRLTLSVFSSVEPSRKDQIEAKGFDVPALQSDETKWILVEAESEFEQSDNKNHVTPLLTFQLQIDPMNEVQKEVNKKNNSLTMKAPGPKTPYKP